MSMSSFFPNKKKGGKTMDKAIESAKPKKKGKETHGMDIRECMAIAADKARLTQEKFLNKDPIEVLDHSEPSEEPIFSQTNQIQCENDKKTSEKCSLCNHKEESRFKRVPAFDEDPFPFSLNQLLAVEKLVTHFTLADINNIYVSKLFNSDEGFTREKMQENILNMKQDAFNNLLEGAALVVNCEKNCSDVQKSNIHFSFCSPPNCSINDKEECKNNLNSDVPKSAEEAESKKDLFDIEDIFNDNDGFNLDLNTKTPQTPLKQLTSPKTSCFVERNVTIDNTSQIKCVNPFRVNGNAPNLHNKTKPMFKIPQLKLNFHTSKSPNAAIQGLGKNVKMSSPESPILSGQITAKSPVSKLDCKVLFPDNHSSLGKNAKTSSPESPILSGKITTASPTSKLERKALFLDKHSSFGKNNKNSSPESPVLSGQITTSSPATKLQCRALFPDNHSRFDKNTLISSPVSPILSGQIVTSTASKPQRRVLFPDAHNVVKNANVSSPESPILSGQITYTGPLRRPDRKILFSENYPDKEDKGSLLMCKPLDSFSIIPNLPCNEVSQNMITCSQLFDSEPPAENIKDISISQLFDDSSNEENKHHITVSQIFDDEIGEDNMSDSSMYTISQMVAKVAEMRNNNEKTADVELKNQRTVNQLKNTSIHFGGSDDEDSIFANIDLDQISGVKQGEPLKTNELSAQVSLTNSSVIKECDKKVYTINNPNVTVCKLNKSAWFSNSLLGPKRVTTEAKDKHSDDIFSSLESAYRKNTLQNKTVIFGQQRKPESKWLSCSKFINKSMETRSTVGVTPVQSTDVEAESDTNSDASLFISPIEQKMKNKREKKESRLARRNRKEKGFVEFEADVSGAPQSSDEENTSGLDDLDDSFINDQTEMPVTPSRSTSQEHSVVDMQSHYLQSVKSPFHKAGRYKIPTMSDSVLAMDVFSQAVQPDRDSYLNDSFCCDATEIPMDNYPSVLEVAEKILNKKIKVRKRKRRLSCGSSDSSFEGERVCSKKDKKRRRLCSSSSSDSESKFVHNIKSVKRKNQITDSSPENLLPTKVQTSSRKDRRRNLLTSDDSDSDKTP